MNTTSLQEDCLSLAQEMTNEINGDLSYVPDEDVNDLLSKVTEDNIQEIASELAQLAYWFNWCTLIYPRSNHHSGLKVTSLVTSERLKLRQVLHSLISEWLLKRISRWLHKVNTSIECIKHLKQLMIRNLSPFVIMRSRCIWSRRINGKSLNYT